MQNRQALTFIAILATLLASAGLAFAQPDRPGTSAAPSPVIGSWSFQTEAYRDGTCQMSGQMRIRPSTSPTALNCSFVAVEECAGLDRWVVEQTCEVSKQKNQLTISSQIVSFLESKEFTGSYSPDHFVLNLTNKDLMTGSLVSAINAPVKFRREEENLS